MDPTTNTYMMVVLVAAVTGFILILRGESPWMRASVAALLFVVAGYLFGVLSGSLLNVVTIAFELVALVLVAAVLWSLVSEARKRSRDDSR